MNDFIIACGSCLLAGILTTIHPCPLATNIASISFLSGLTSNKNRIGAVVFFFVCGYLISYLILGIIISSGLLSIPLLSVKLQKSISILLGPVLIFLGMLMADLISLQQFYKGRLIRYLQTRKWNPTGALPFGIFVSLSFCPATAGIFFGILIPLAIKYEKMILFPLIYALGASLPVIAISILIAQGAVLNNRTRWIRIMPVISGWILIAIGIYLSIKRIYLV
jgi:cytochrome c-type biogenesis protein